MKGYLDVTLDNFMDQLSEETKYENFNESTKDFEESVAIDMMGIAIEAWTILSVGIYIYKRTVNILNHTKASQLLDKVEHKCSSKDSGFIEISLMAGSKHSVRKKSMSSDLADMVDVAGKELKGLSGFFKRAFHFGSNIVDIYSYKGKPIFCATICHDKGRSVCVAAIADEYKKYKSYYVGAYLYMKEYYTDACSVLTSIENEISNDIEESVEIPISDTIDLWLEESDFEEGAGLFAGSKFNKVIQDALSATYALCRYSYGVEKDGHIYNVDRSEYPRWYHYLSRQDFQRLKGGLSFDYCRFLYPYLVNKGYDVELFFIELEGTNITHTFPMLKVPYGNGFKYLYCEAALKYICGCYSTNNLDDMISAIVSVLRDFTIITKPTNVLIRKYKPIKNDDLSYAELLKELRKNEIYDKWVIKPRANASSSSAKASKFNPGLLTRINPEISRIS